MKRYSIGVFLIVASFLAASCTVLEERTPCPGELVVDISDLNRTGVDGTVQVGVFDGMGNKVEGALVPAGQDSVVFILPKDDYVVGSAVFQDNTLFTADERLFVKAGEQSDRVWSFSENVTLSGEQTVCRGTYHKQYSLITVKNASVAAGEDDFFGMEVTVTGRWCGLDLRDCSSFPGEFRYILRRGGNGLYRFSMLRQGGADLVMHLASADCSFDVPVGRYLDRMGYDFDAVDLMDVTVTFSIASLTVTIEIEDWNRKRLFEII